MAKRAPSPPPAPDPVATAQAQGQINDSTARLNARLNRTDQITPYGNLTFEDLGGDRWRAITQLSPSQQRQLELSNQAQEVYGNTALEQLRRVSGRMASPFSLDGIGFNSSRDQVESALMERLAPRLEQDRAGLEARLVAQGLQPGTAAWSNAMRDFTTQSNDARLAVIANARGEDELAMNRRQQAVQEALLLRNQPLQEALALLTGQGINYPQWAPVAQTASQPADFQGAVAQNAAMANNQWATRAQMAGQTNASTMGLLGSLATAGAFAFSDRRLKRGVRRIGEGVHGLPVYEWTYVWGESGVGFMADEVAQVRPDCVVYDAEGFALVSYEGLLR